MCLKGPYWTTWSNISSHSELEDRFRDVPFFNIQKNDRTTAENQETLPGGEPPGQDRTIYRERIFSRNVTFLFILLAIAFLYIGSMIGDEQEFPLKGRDMLIPFFLMFFIAVNFSVLQVRITFWGLYLRYGILHYETPWEKVSTVFQDRTTRGRLIRGWGINVKSLAGGGNRLVYSVPGLPFVVCSMKKGLFAEVAFSSRRLEIAVSAAREGIKRNQSPCEYIIAEPFHQPSLSSRDRPGTIKLRKEKFPRKNDPKDLAG